MIGQKAIKLLKSLSAEEFRRLRKVFQSPLFTTNRHHLKLYDYIRKYHPDFDSPRLRKEVLHEKVFPGRQYHDKRLRDLLSEFTRLIESYLLITELDTEQFERKKMLTRIYGKRDLYELFEKGTKGLLAELDASPLRDMDYYRNQTYLNEAFYFHPMTNKYDLKDESLEILSSGLDAHFGLAKMRFGIALKLKEKVLARKYHIRFIDALKTERSGGFMESDILFRLYELSFKLLEKGSNDDFEKVEKLLFENMENFGEEDQKVLFFNGLNYAIRQKNGGVPGFAKIVLRWYKRGLSSHVIVVNEKIDEVNFGNIVSFGCTAGEFDWTVNFIQNYGQYLEEDRRNDIVIYNKALVHFFQKDFEKTLNLLKNHSFSLAFELQYRSILLLTLFELFVTDNQYFDTLISNITSFETYLRRNKKFSKRKLDPYFNRNKLIRSLAVRIIKKELNEKTRARMEKELNSGIKFVSKNWLREKIRVSE